MLGFQDIFDCLNTDCIATEPVSELDKLRVQLLRLDKE
jgi:hypothetical protein